MKKILLDWTVSHTPDLSVPAVDTVPAKVPGAVQLDYAEAKGYKPYYRELNFRQFDWMEKEYFIYRSKLSFECGPLDCALLCFGGIDYRYIIKIDGKTFADGEGMFTPVTIDVTPFSGKSPELEVILFPIPTNGLEKRDRAQAAASCKPASSYTWDWHPRLVPSGIWEEAYIKVIPLGSPTKLEASYRLSDDLRSVTVTADVDVCGMGSFEVALTDPDGNVCVSEKRDVGENQTERFILNLNNPRLWYPRGYGEQPVYKLSVKGADPDALTRSIGFRSSKLVRNAEDVKRFERAFPMTALPAPATIEINGVRVFAKGSNWVNAEIFPCNITDKRYDELLKMAYDANMNILRLWGGQIINREYFYDKCDRLGIMVWQEFMLSCNRHPDTDEYLKVLRQEATTIIKRLRTHPCIAFWCGGNELFNSWSGLTVQSHPLRMLDSLCFELDRFTPFNMTSPLHGMGHGTYVKVVISEGDNDEKTGPVKGEEYISVIKRSGLNAYTEFGCNGGATPEYIKKYIMDENNYQDCNASNEIWKEHHAFEAWNKSTWLGKSEVRYYFGTWDSVDDLMEKTLYLQSMAYKTMFEEMRRQWPHCSMAVNWDFNEPWPCAAGNSLINWPAEPKPALHSVGEALRPTLISMSAPRNRYLTGDELTADIWVLNDSPEKAGALTVKAYLTYGETKRLLGTVNTCEVAPRSNDRFGSVSCRITADIPQRFALSLECAEHPEYNSVYDLVHLL